MGNLPWLRLGQHYRCTPMVWPVLKSSWRNSHLMFRQPCIIGTEMFCSGAWALLKLTAEMRHRSAARSAPSHDLPSLSLATSLSSFLLCSSAELGGSGFPGPAELRLSSFLWVDFSFRFLLCEFTSPSMFSALQELFSSRYPSTLGFLGTWIPPQDPNTWERGWNVLKYFCFLQNIDPLLVLLFHHKKDFLQKGEEKMKLTVSWGNE